ncbi:MAG: hypothetical protein ACRDXX_11655 [Stackebrandtia sp.]
MIEHDSQVLLRVAAAGKLWNSTCQQTMTAEQDDGDGTRYRCADPCGQHTADIEKVKAGLLWHYRGRRVDKTYGMRDEQIVDEMLSALHMAWVRDGEILTAQFH